MGKKIKSAAWECGGGLSLMGAGIALCSAIWLDTQSPAFLALILVPLVGGVICEARKAQQRQQ